MKRFSLNKNWEYLEANLQNPLMVGMLQGWQKTDLPHDYAAERPRRSDSAGGLDEGFMISAPLYYRKSFVVEPAAADQRFWLEFEGIAGVTEVWVNRKLAMKHNNPYTSFSAEVTDLLHTGENEIMVYTDNRTKPNSRWYVGCGICRSVWMYMAAPVSAVPHGIRAVTQSIHCDSAVLCAEVELTGNADKIDWELTDTENRVLAAAEGRKVSMQVSNITPWTPETPVLYNLRAKVWSGDTCDCTEQHIGLRTVTVDSKNGLLLNGQPRTMKGGCIHHDNGILGAADFDAANRRRIRLLKESGFDALRLAHNPYSPTFLDACDELGILVVEEAFDEWVLGRTAFGLHTTFESCWEKDLEDMIARDYNHPSIVMWSTGNEVEERDGSADGFAWAKRLADKVRSLDTSRPVSATACALFSEYGSRPAGGTTGNQALNMAYDAFAEGNDIWGPGTADYFVPLDVAGYNYKVARYAYDAEKYPNRVIYGSESYPRAALLSWQGARDNANVIGDFVWTAWDYIGEVGVGRWEVSEAERPSNPGWPWLTANCGDFDLIGRKRPQSFYRDVVWGNTAAPRIFCLPPELVGKHLTRLSWAWLPVQRSYTWPGDEGQPVEAHIYADADEVELFLNGHSLGRRPCTEQEKYQAVFTFAYQPGTLLAVSYRDGQETGRDELSTAGNTHALRLLSDCGTAQTDGNNLAFVLIQAVDEAGNPVPNENREISVSVSGAALAALGTANPKPETPLTFKSSVCPLYNGEALAIVRGTPKETNAVLTVTMDEMTAEIPVAFAQQPGSDGSDLPVHECRNSAAAELPLVELLQKEKARPVLAKLLGPLLESPMLNQLQKMSLKKLLSMSGQSIPADLLDELERAVQE